MSRPATLLSLRNQVRQRSDTENSTDRFADAEVNEYINESVSGLNDMLVQADQDYAMSSTTFTTTSGQEMYALPADFYKVRGVDVSYGGLIHSLRRWKWEEREMYNYAGGWVADYPIAYRVIGGNLDFKPVPQGQYSVTLWYYPAPARLAADTDTVDGVAGWEEYVVLDAATKILTKDDRDASMLIAERDRVQARILRMVGSRYSTEPDRITRRRSAFRALRVPWRPM